MIYIVAILTSKPAQREALLAEFKNNAAIVRGEAGCIQYQPVIDIEGGPEMLAAIGPDAFMVLEQWENRAAAEAHAASAHMAKYAERVKGLLSTRVIYALRSA
jgi:quinol monooxygenase YgiN